MHKSARVFGIGFHKTGTTTLGLALEQLGYSVAHGALEVRQSLGPQELRNLLYHGDFTPLFDAASQYNAMVDVPWFVLFRELDVHFPRSKFILTTRDETHWIRSAIGYYGTSESNLRHWIYGVGSPVGNEAVWLARYRKHHELVMEYFAERQQDLLIVDWEQGHGWKELASFLGCSVPDMPFPKANPATSVDRMSVANQPPPSDYSPR